MNQIFDAPHGATRHNGVTVVCDGDRDPRVLAWLDLLPDRFHRHLAIAHEHEGGLFLYWRRDPPMRYMEGCPADFPDDFWLVAESLPFRDWYGEYCRSQAWRQRADAARARAGGRCQLCNGNSRLHVHHRTYERVGLEDEGDLTVLCQRCHKRHHGRG